MIKAGSIYSRKPSHRRNTCIEIAAPRPKDNFLYLKSTSDEVDSRRESIFFCDNAGSPLKENLMEEVNAYSQKKSVQVKESPLEDFFDSLTQYERKPTEDPNIKLMVSLQQIFREMRGLQELERDRNGKRWLSDIENKLLSFERGVLNL